jgi:hypothetical protein
MAVFTIFPDFPIAVTTIDPQPDRIVFEACVARCPRAKPYITTKDKMLDYIVAQLPAQLTPSGLILTAAELPFRSWSS